MITTLCISGGGVKGFSFISALHILIKHNYLDLNKINKYVGTSVGAILCFLFCIDYSPYELITYGNNFDFKNIDLDLDLNLFLTNFGFNDGKCYIELVSTLFERKFKLTNINFNDLYILTKKKLFIIGTNFTLGKEEIFSCETTPTMLILDALRISISIPLVLTPIKYNNHYYVDGGVLNNIAFELCDPINTLCFCLKDSKCYNLDTCFDLVTGIINLLIRKKNKDICKYKTIYIYYNDCDLPLSCNKDSFVKILDVGYKNGIKFLIKEYKNKINKITKNINDNKNNINEVVKVYTENIKDTVTENIKDIITENYSPINNIINVITEDVVATNNIINVITEDIITEDIIIKNVVAANDIINDIINVTIENVITEDDVATNNIINDIIKVIINDIVNDIIN